MQPENNDPPKLELPPLPENLTYTTETHFVLCVSCFKCQGTGRDQDQSLMYNPTKTLDDLRCKDCGGTGRKNRYITLHELYEVMEPVFMEKVIDKFLEKLPEILASMQYEVVRSIMES